MLVIAKRLFGHFRFSVYICLKVKVFPAQNCPRDRNDSGVGEGHQDIIVNITNVFVISITNVFIANTTTIFICIIVILVMPSLVLIIVFNTSGFLTQATRAFSRMTHDDGCDLNMVTNKHKRDTLSLSGRLLKTRKQTFTERMFHAWQHAKNRDLK